MTSLQVQTNSAGFDPWGLDPELYDFLSGKLKWLYDHYFRVKIKGIENVGDGPVLLVSNHGGQFPIDGMLITMAMFYSREKPRPVRALVDRWVPSLPFVSTFFSRCGHLIGDPKNAADLLKNGQCVLVFPEGTKGSGKTIWRRYQLQKFGTGFLRLALEAKVPIVPVSVVGSEEMYPALFQLRRLAKFIGIPYFPVTPFFPFMGVLGLVPLPIPTRITFGEPMHFDSQDASRAEVLEMVEEVRSRIKAQIKDARAEQGNED